MENILDKLINSSDNYLIMGPGGTGKSTLLKKCYKEFKDRKLPVGVITPTGISSFNLSKDGVPSVTAHSLFNLPIIEIQDINFIRLSKNKEKLLKRLKVIIFDEISMITPVVFDTIFYLFNKLNNQPRVLMFGDPFQLAPVIKFSNDLRRYYSFRGYEPAFFFSTNYYKFLRPKVIILDKIYRQSDQKFIEILNRVRLHQETDDDLDILNSRVTTPSGFSQSHNNFLYLASTNKRVDQLNNLYQRAFEGKPYYNYESESEGTLKPKSGEEDILKIYEGMQVMCTYNNSSEGYQNGTLGVVKTVRDREVIVNSNNKNMSVLYGIEFDNDYKWDPRTNEVKVDQKGYYSQIGCRPAFALTIHKSQSLTLDAVYIDLDNWVTTHMVYIALSRVRNLNDLGLFREIHHSDIIINPEVKYWYDNLTLVK